MNDQEILKKLWNSTISVVNGNASNLMSDVQFHHTIPMHNSQSIINIPQKQGETCHYIIIETNAPIESNASESENPSIGDNQLLNDNNSSITYTDSVNDSMCSSLDFSAYKKQYINPSGHKKRRLSYTESSNIFNTNYNNNNNNSVQSVGTIAIETDSNNSPNISTNNHNTDNNNDIDQQSPANNPNTNNNINIDQSPAANNDNSNINNDMYQQRVANNDNSNNNNDIHHGMCHKTLVIKYIERDDDDASIFKFHTIKHDEMANCALRVVSQIRTNGKMSGVLLLCKNIQRGMERFTAVPIDIKEVDKNNLNSFVKHISTRVSICAGINSCFAPIVTGKSGEKELGVVFMRRFIYEQFKSIVKVVDAVHWLGSARVGDREFLILGGGQILDLQSGDLVDPFSAGIYLDDIIGSVDPMKLKNYPRIININNQTNEPLSAADQEFLDKKLGMHNIGLVVIGEAMNLIGLIGQNDLKKYGGGTNQIMVIYGTAKSTKSWTLRLTQSLMGVDSFSNDPSIRGDSVLISDDWTNAAVVDDDDRYRGFKKDFEDADRPGNKQKAGGAEGIIWCRSSLIGKSMTRGGGEKHIDVSPAVITVNSLPGFLEKNQNHQNMKNEKDKQEGTYSRCDFFLHSANFDVSKNTEKERRIVNEGIAEISSELTRRTKFYYTKCKPKHKTMVQCGKFIDLLNNEINNHHEHLSQYIDSRVMGNDSVKMAYCIKPGKIYGLTSNDLMSVFRKKTFDFAELQYKYHGNPLVPMQIKYTSPDEVVTFFLYCYYVVESDLSIVMDEKDDEINV
eukprot:127963_1